MASSWAGLHDFGVNFLGAVEEQGEVLATQPQRGLLGEICWKDTVMCTGFSVSASLFCFTRLLYRHRER